MDRKSRKQQQMDVKACARDWTSKPKTEQMQYARTILSHYLRLRSLQQPDRAARATLDMIKQIIREYQKLQKPQADTGFVDRYLAVMEQMFLRNGPSYNIKDIVDLVQLVPPMVECN
jgi:hypothetical protein